MTLANYLASEAAREDVRLAMFCFAHVIDKQYGPDEHLNAIHNGDGGVTPRC